MARPNDDANLRIAIAWRELRRVRALRFDSLDTGQIDALDHLRTLGPCTMVALSTAMHVDPSTATRAVDRLVREGLVSRRGSPDDGRVVLVELTSAGRKLHTGISRRRMADLDRILDGFSDDERRELAGWLERLVAATHRNAGVAPDGPPRSRGGDRDGGRP